MANSELEVCNRAIGRISGDRIDELGEDSPLGVWCLENYAAKRRYFLSMYRWTFANRTAQLAREVVEADAVKPLDYRFARPADLVGAVHAWRDHPDPTQGRRVYVLDSGGKFWAATPTVYAEYTRAVPEADWPAWFEQLAVTALAAELADFAQMTTKARDLRVEAWGLPSEGGKGGLFATAMEADASLAPPRQLVSGVDPGPLVEVRLTSQVFGWDGTFIDPPGY